MTPADLVAPKRKLLVETYRAKKCSLRQTTCFVGLVVGGVQLTRGLKAWPEPQSP